MTNAKLLESFIYRYTLLLYCIPTLDTKFNMEEQIQKKDQYTLMKDLKGYLTAEDVDKILSYVLQKDCMFKERNYLFILMLFRTGRRVSELLSLNTNKINFKQRSVIWNILKKKTKKESLKSLDSETFRLLCNYIEIEDTSIRVHDGRVFNFKRDWARKMVKNYCQGAGYNLIGAKLPHPHHFRHSFAVHFLTHANRNEAIKILQQELEHSDIKITAEYLQFDQEDARKIKDEIFKKKNIEEGTENIEEETE